jgi:hypothetical protein
MPVYTVTVVRPPQPAQTHEVEVQVDNMSKAMLEVIELAASGEVFDEDLVNFSVTQVVESHEVEPPTLSFEDAQDSEAMLARLMGEARRYEMDPKEPMFKIWKSGEMSYQVMTYNILHKTCPRLFDQAISLAGSQHELTSLDMKEALQCRVKAPLGGLEDIYIQRLR